MLRLMNAKERILIKDDPVRPRFSYEWRVSLNREVWVWENDLTGNIDSVICTAYTDEIPTSEDELDYYSTAAAFNGGRGNTVVFYTVWSYSPGAGRTLVNELALHLRRTRPNLTRWVTLSPLTEMATRFHTSNGARLLQVNTESQNFDYTEQVKLLFSSDSYQSI